MHKKFLSCLSYTLLLTVSFFLLGFTEAARLPQKSFSPVADVPVEDSYAGILSFSSSITLDEKVEGPSALFPPKQVEIYGVTLQTSVTNGLSDLTRKLPVAVLVMCRLKLGHWRSADDFTYFLPVSLSMAPGLPVLLRTLRL